MKSFFNFEQREGKLALVLIAPTLIAVLGILFYPLVYSFVISFGDVELSNIKSINFIGFANYIRAFRDPNFINSLFVSAKFVFTSIFIKLVLGTLVAVMLNERFIGRGIVRSLVIIPWATPYIVTGIIWKWLLHSKVGVVNFLLLKFGIINDYIPFLSSKVFALPSIILADVWQGTPFFIIIILAGLQTIPEELYEAAKIDGAGGIKSFFHITIPMAKMQILVATILGTIDSINAFDLFFMLTKGGPGTLTTNLTLFDWKNAFKFYHLSYASAISYIIFGFSMVLALAYIRVLRKGEER